MPLGFSVYKKDGLLTAVALMCVNCIGSRSASDQMANMDYGIHHRSPVALIVNVEILVICTLTWYVG